MQVAGAGAGAAVLGEEEAAAERRRDRLREAVQPVGDDLAVPVEVGDRERVRVVGRWSAHASRASPASTHSGDGIRAGLGKK
jgi:hypothetical protein